jgi:hypothetical protein
LNIYKNLETMLVGYYCITIVFSFKKHLVNFTNHLRGYG